MLYKINKVSKVSKEIIIMILLVSGWSCFRLVALPLSPGTAGDRPEHRMTIGGGWPIMAVLVADWERICQQL